MVNGNSPTSRSALRRIPVGLKCGRWTVMGSPEVRGLCRVLKVPCRCECGAEGWPQAVDLVTGNSKSCGCLRSEIINSEQHRAKMRAAPRRRAEPVPSAPPEEGRHTWHAMLDRCHNPQSKSYRHYGGRGIAVCDRWRNSFRDFINDMGLKPTPRHSIDRIDNNGNYEPGNCRWATATQQARNTRKNRMLTLRGETLCLSDWADRAGRPASWVRSRLNRGLSPEEAIFGPPAVNTGGRRRIEKRRREAEARAKETG